MLSSICGFGVPFPSPVLLVGQPGTPPGPEVEAPPTRMSSTGTFRNGPGIYTGFTVVSGSGSVKVYDGPDAVEGRLIHSIAAASAGNTYELAQPETITNGWVVLGAGVVVDIHVDD